MIRINLIPPEITEKRKAEQRWKYVVLGAVVLYTLLAVFWFGMFLRVSSREADVAGKKQEAQSLTQQAESFKIFEDREKDLAARKTVAEKALAGRRQWSKLMNETALILPADAWLTRLHMDEKTYNIGGQSVDSAGESGGSGFKPIAKLLVHMSDLQQIQNVWLDSSQKADFLNQPVLTFSVAAEMVQPDTPKTAANAPAPPAQ